MKDDRDREKFGELLGELVERSGFEIFCWVLMGHPNRAATLVRRDPASSSWGAEWKQAKKLMGQLERALKI